MGKELPSQRLVKIKLGKVLLLKQITQQRFNLKELCEKKKQFHGENRQFREENKQFREENKQLNVQLVEVNMNVNVCLDPYVTVSSDGHGHGTEGHDRLLTVCFDRLDRLERSNVIVLIVLEGQTDDHGHRFLGIKDDGFDRL